MQGFVTALPDIRVMVLPKPPMTSPLNAVLSMLLMLLYGASRAPTAVVGTIVVTVAFGVAMLYTTSNGKTPSVT